MAQDRKLTIDLNINRTDHSGRVTTAQLEVTTRKGYRGGVRTDACVLWVGDGFKTYGLFQDFNKALATRQGAATQRNIDECHAFATTPERIAEVTVQGKAHYATAQTRREEQS